MELLPPGPKDKLRAHCRLFRHEWTREWLLPTHNMYGREIIKYKLCLRCSDYVFFNLTKWASKKIKNAFGVTPIQIPIDTLTLINKLDDTT